MSNEATNDLETAEIESKVQVLPIDLTTIEKGDTISVNELEDITGYKYSTNEYGLAVLKIQNHITRALDDMGTPMVVRGDKGGLRILTDSEATEYLEQCGNQALARLGRTVMRLGQVDTSQLTESERAAHERRHIVQGRTFQGAISERKKIIKLMPYKRQTPGLPLEEVV